jgi:peptidyl-tRNA hydrolase, PTH1 family
VRFLSGLFKKIFGRGDNDTVGRENENQMSRTMLIVGLGNPGKEYARTRHNVGFAVIDSLATQLGIEVTAKKFGGLIGQGRYQDKKLIAVKPQQYMNCSGQVVASVLGFYKLAISDVVVVADDMALEPGVIRIRSKGSAGGHNGLADIIEKLGTDEFARLRVGIGKNAFPDARDYVLGEPSKEEKELIADGINKAHQALLCWLTDGLEKAMNKFN